MTERGRCCRRACRPVRRAFPSQALSRHPPPSRFRRGQGKKRAASRAPRVFLQAEPRGYFSLDICRNSHYNKQALRGVAQLVARMVRDHEAASSSLATPTKKRQRANALCLFLVGVAESCGLRDQSMRSMVWGKAPCRCRWQMQAGRFFRSGRKTQGSA